MSLETGELENICSPSIVGKSPSPTRNARPNGVRANPSATLCGLLCVFLEAIFMLATPLFVAYTIPHRSVHHVACICYILCVYNFRSLPTTTFRYQQTGQRSPNNRCVNRRIILALYKEYII